MRGLAPLRCLPLTFGILPLYMLPVPYGVLVLALARRGPALPLSLGLGLWLVAQAEPSWSPPRLLPELTGIGRWEFNPLAWQILFTLGLTLSLQASARGPLVRPRRWLDILAVALVVAGPVIKLGCVLAVAPDALRTLDRGPARDLLLARLLGWTGLGAALCAGHAAFRDWVDSGRKTTPAPRQSP